MPKDRKTHKSKFYSLTPYSRHGKGLAVAEGGDFVGAKDWEGATCPICMDFPHNAVLLLCTSHDKGCRPFMCDTSYRHSNCFDQYRKAHTLAGKAATSNDSPVTPWPGGGALENQTLFIHGGNSEDPSNRNRGRESPIGTVNGLPSSVKQEPPDLSCPLCRGCVVGWIVVEAARQFLNNKARNCSQEACSFAGSYGDLRAHARSEHPSARPSEVDPARQRKWRRLERQRELGDVLSTIRSAMPGATFFGDYVIDGQVNDHENENNDGDFPGDEGHWWTVFLLFQVLGPAVSFSGRRMLPSRTRGLARDWHRSTNARHALWGENLHYSDEGNSSSGSSDTGEQTAGSSRRRHRSRH